VWSSVFGFRLIIFRGGEESGDDDEELTNGIFEAISACGLKTLGDRIFSRQFCGRQ
jgi:hypothetical protein